MRKHTLLMVVSAALMWASVLSLQAAKEKPAGGPAVSVQTSAAAVSPAGGFVSQYCVTCHNQRSKAGGLVLGGMDITHIGDSAATWEKVVSKLRLRSMPPAGNRRPDNGTYDAVSSWLESELDQAALAHPNPGRPAVHRLNRVEYANAIRDLLAVDIDGTALLPPDDQAYGFDNNADALSMTPALLDRYLSAATKIARTAVGDASVRPGFERYTAVKNNTNERTWLWQTDRLGEDFPLGSRGGIAATHNFPVDGEYVFRIRLDRTYRGVVRGLNRINHIFLYVDGVRVGQFTIGGTPVGKGNPRGAAAGDDPEEGNAYSRTADDKLEARVPAKAGSRRVVATVVKADNVEPEGLGPYRLPIWSHLYDGDQNAEMIIAALLVGGPYNGKVPEDSASRRRIFSCYPGGASEETACAIKILTTLARRAYRRPTTNEDVEALLDFYKSGRAQGDFDSGIQFALERILVSPDFLLRIERDPLNVAPGTAYRLSDLELASRLSFFLWSSIPDDELLDVAAQGRLKDAAMLENQTRRMLADPRARESLVNNFFEQWLQIRNVWALTPDANRKFPWFDDNLRVALVTETELFLRNQLEEDHSVVDLLSANYTFLNERLAKHYGISGVYGSHFRKVTLTDPNRGGLLGQGSILAVTSYPNRTAPTIRGKWLLENFLAAPPPAPPPNVPPLKEDGDGGQPRTMREAMEQHRKNPVCASCHALMDPLGFGLENFDAIGRYRTLDAGTSIDASGVLLDGTKFNGSAGLRQALVERKGLFVAAVTGKVLMYALGRNLEYYDAPAVREIVRMEAASDYRWSSAILGIVKSVPFQMRRSGS